MNLTQKFWDMATDNIVAIDPSMVAILGIQYNLGAGTLIPWAARRPELRPLMKRIMDFDVKCVATSPSLTYVDQACSLQFMVSLIRLK
jgi:hypothetical protein